MLFRRRGSILGRFGILGGSEEEIDEEEIWKELDEEMKEKYKEWFEDLVIAEVDFGEDP